MKIALVMEYSTAVRNEIVFETLKKVAEANGHEVVNYGQFGVDDVRQTYPQNAVLTSAILNSGAADFVVTGCGTGEGAMMACNALPGVCCGLIVDPADSFLFTQVNNGNCISLPYAKGWGWGAEVNLEFVFEKLFVKEPGGGYPASAAESERRNAGLLNKLKKEATHSIVELIGTDEPDIHEMVVNAFAGKRLEIFRENCKCDEIMAAVDRALAK